MKPRYPEIDNSEIATWQWAARRSVSRLEVEVWALMLWGWLSEAFGAGRGWFLGWV